ncbi:MAG: synthase protein [Frankiales bacterium]|jgi:hypothetical protein|nr:hypothetical protein [Frankiales bacterium]MCW2707604.1 hypothetical protein [Frankiales bacterium]MDX6219780.1 synthase protein [Frankiales bacterium]MDX6268557.1 synthase protein [Frankiales bacterium]
MSTGPEDSPSTPDKGPVDDAHQGADRWAGQKAHDDMWAATGLLISGVVVWGGAGYLVSEWLHNQLFVMFGLLLGTATALYGIWFRYGRS